MTNPPLKNLWTDLPASLREEMANVLAETPHVRIERIVSMGHVSPPGFWYDQKEHEWVVVLKGASILRFDDGVSIKMGPGDHLLIPAHRKHRVDWTTPDEATLWLAVFFHDAPGQGHDGSARGNV